MWNTGLVKEEGLGRTREIMSHATPVQVLLERPLTRGIIAGLKLRAFRRRVWYGALNRIERGPVDLTIRWVDKVRSRRLTETLLRILVKLARQWNMVWRGS